MPRIATDDNWSVGKLALRVELDDDPQSPREWDNVGTIACFHRRYSLSDEGATDDLDHDDFESWEEIESHLRETCAAVAMLPIYMYEHGGITLSTSPFSCSWDSGRVGVIWTSAARLAELGVLPESAEAALRAEIEEFDRYVRGEAYVFLVEDAHGRTVEICGGFSAEDDARDEGAAKIAHLVESRPAPCAQAGLRHCQGDSES